MGLAFVRILERSLVGLIFFLRECCSPGLLITVGRGRIRREARWFGTSGTCVLSE